jgi:hypothetical protein
MLKTKNRKTEIYEPYYNSWKEVIKEIFHIKYLTNKVYYITLLSYLIGVYNLFFICIPIVILISIGFLYMFVFHLNKLLYSCLGNEDFKKLSKKEKDEIIKKDKSTINLVKIVILLYHIIPAIVCLNILQKHKENSNSYFKNNLLFFVNNSIIVSLVLILLTDINIYGKLNLEYSIVLIPIIILITCLIIYN